MLDPNWALDADGVSDVAWGNFFQGHPFDAMVGGSVARNRIVLHHLGRPLQADPLGYPDGMSRYQWESSNPTGRLDPNGLMTTQARTGIARPATGPDDAERREAEEALRRTAAMEGRLRRLNSDDFREREAASAELLARLRAGELQEDYDTIYRPSLSAEQQAALAAIDRKLAEIREAERAAREAERAAREAENAMIFADLWVTVHQEEIDRMRRAQGLARQLGDQELVRQLQIQMMEEAGKRNQRIGESNWAQREMDRALGRPPTPPTPFPEDVPMPRGPMPDMPQPPDRPVDSDGEPVLG